MPSPNTILPWILGGVIGLGGILQGIHWKSTASEGDLTELENQLRIAQEENELLKRENESLRSLAQGGGDLSVPQELIDRIEKEFDLLYLSTPVVHRIAGEELRDRIAAALESRFGPAGIDYRQEAYSLIGWIRAEDRLLAQLTAVRAVGAKGWFDDVTGEAWVTDSFNLEAIPDQAALVRLLSRILLHQHFPPPPGYPGDDPSRAREALHHGAASGSESRFLAANARAIGFMPMKENTEAGQMFMSLPPFIQGLTTFSSIEGKGLADTLHVKGNEIFQAAFRHPPTTTQAIIFPGEPKPAPPPLQIDNIEGEPFLSESAGMLGLRLWMEPLGDVGAANEIASGWINDRYILHPQGQSQSALVWEIQFESQTLADRFQSLALDLVAALAGQEDPAQLAKPAPTPEGRLLEIQRPAPDRVRFLNRAAK